MMILEILLVLLGGIILLSAGRLLLGQLLLPVQDLLIFVPARGNGNDLEHTVKGLRYLSSSGLLDGASIYLNDMGLDSEGRLVAARLCLQDPQLHICTLTAEAETISGESRCPPSTTNWNKN